MEKIHTLLKTHKNYENLIKNTKQAYEMIEEIFKKYSHKVLHDNLGYNIKMEMVAMRMMAIHDLVDNGFLALPENTSTSTLGMHIILK